MHILAQHLKSSRLLSALSLETLETLLIPNGSIQTYGKKQLIFDSQEKITHIHIVISGKIYLAHLFTNGNYGLITTLNPKESLGLELVATKTQLSPYMAISAANSETFSFPASLILSKGILPEEERLAVLSEFLTMISHFNIQKEYRLAILSQNGLRDRIMTYLTMQAAKRGTNHFFIPFTREEMASYLCVNRSALSHELGLLKKEGIIHFRKNEFTLLNIDYL